MFPFDDVIMLASVKDESDGYLWASYMRICMPEAGIKEKDK